MEAELKLVVEAEPDGKTNVYVGDSTTKGLGEWFKSKLSVVGFRELFGNERLVTVNVGHAICAMYPVPGLAQPKYQSH